MQIIHRDIKPANLLIKDDKIKISDFGVSRVLNDMKQKAFLTFVGSPAYSSP